MRGGDGEKKAWDESLNKSIINHLYKCVPSSLSLYLSLQLHLAPSLVSVQMWGQPPLPRAHVAANRWG